MRGLLLSVFILYAPATPAQNRIELATQALKSGDFAGARFQLETALVTAPDRVEVALMLARVWGQQEQRDEELRWLMTAAIWAKGKKHADRINKSLANRDPLLQPRTTLLTRTIPALLTMANAYTKNKIYGEAGRCLAGALAIGITNPDWAARADKIQKVLRRQGNQAALKESGLAKTTPAKSAAWLRQFDRTHSTWKKRAKVRTPNYTIETTCGYQLAHAVAGAMEKLNKYFRQVYGVKLAGGKITRIKVLIFPNRAEFTAYRMLPDMMTSGGYFSPSTRELVSFDPRSNNRQLNALFETLAHEGSHQFLQEKIKKSIPSWLNEGYATYFEGCRIYNDGTIRRNDIALPRLGGLVALGRSGKLDLARPINAESNIEPADYCVAWGLIHMFMHRRDSRGELSYRKQLHKLLTICKRGGQKNQLAQFKRLFIKEVKDPAVQDLPQLTNRLCTWAKQLSAMERHDPTALAALLTRGTDFYRAGHLVAAADLLTRYCAYNPTGTDGLYTLGCIQNDQGKTTLALTSLRRAYNLLIQQPKSTLDPKNIMAVINQCDPCHTQRQQLIDPLPAAWRELSQAYKKKGYILASMLAAQVHLTLQPEPPGALATLTNNGHQTLYLPQTLWTGGPLTSWAKANTCFQAIGETLVYDRQDSHWTDRPCQAKPPFRLRVEIKVTDQQGAFGGIIFNGRGESFRQAIALNGNGTTALYQGTRQTEAIKHTPLPKNKFHRLEVALETNKLRIFLNEKLIYLRNYKWGDLTRIGLIAGKGKITFRHLQILTPSPF